MKAFRILFFFLVCCNGLYGETSYLQLKGYLGKEELTEAHKTVDSLSSGEGNTLVVTMDASSGDLSALLDFAAKVYQFKEAQGLEVVFFINENALGPPALLPFIADELYTSHFVSWGDIPLGAGDQMPTNILRNKVVSLIGSDKGNADVWKILAAAMCDPAFTVVEEGGRWRLSNEEVKEGAVNRAGEALVVNHSQLKQLGLVKATLSLSGFLSRFISSSEPGKEELLEVKKALSVPQNNYIGDLRKYIKFDAKSDNTIGRILIDDRTSGISQSTWLYVKTALDHYKKTKPAFIILELNTPGGEVFASQQISDALKDLDINFGIPVVACINNWAISAGAMLAYSCRFITVVKDGSMGAAEPVLAGEGGEMKTASEKINSALRTDFANRAQFFDRNPDIAEAMVDKDIILVFRNGKILKLSNEDQIRSKGPSPDIVISAKGKLLTLNARQLVDYGVADAMLEPQRLVPITEAEKVEGQWPFSKTLLGQQPFFKELTDATVVIFSPDWRTQFFILLASPVVSSLLMLGLLMGFYLEINTPGVGLPGAVAFICLLLILISNLSLELASWLEVVFLAAGVLLIVVDLFIIPTGGILLFAGGLITIGGLFAIMLPNIGSINYEFDTQTMNAAGELFFKRFAWLCGTLVAAFVMMFILGRWIRPTFIGLNRIVLMGHEQDSSQGYIAGERSENLPPHGALGQVLATLRPAGKVEIDGEIYEAVTDGAFIEKGVKIMVEKLDGSVIVVTRVVE